MYTIKFKRSLLYSALLATMLIAGAAYAANWLMLQGTESASTKQAKLWGFVQAQYQHDFSDPYVNAGGAKLYNPPKLIAPNLDAQSGFNIYRARIGVRGANPLDSNTNYFFLAEFGNNGITYGNGAVARLTDASITLNHIPHARIRLGLFKTPGVDEGLQGGYICDYINFTSVTKQLMMERFPDANDTNKAPSTTPIANLNQYSNPVGAFRDVGIMLFDMFKINDWEHTYAITVGNGNGLNFSDNDSNKDMYVYWSSEKVFSGKGSRRSGWKTFAWLHEGKRTNVYNTSESQNRQRYGIGSKYLQKPFRMTAEYMQGKGMIFQGSHRPTQIFNDLKASGWYVESGWYIPNTNFEIDLRFDTYTREENHPTSVSGDESRFNNWTIGAQYHFNKKTRISINYAIRDAESDTVACNNHLQGVGGRLALQVTAIY